MYNCYQHGWSSLNQQCPSCTVISVATVSEAQIPDYCYTSIKVSDLERLKQIIKDYEAALEVYAMTNETFPEYGAVAREVLKKIRGTP